MSFSHGITLEIDSGSVMHETIKYGICYGWIIENLVPFFNWQLACQDSRCLAVSVFNDLQEVPIFGVGQRSQALVVLQSESLSDLSHE